MDNSSLVPKKISKTEDGIEVLWRDDHRGTYPLALLRARCPCATCRHNPPRVVREDDPLKLIDDVPIQLERAQLVGQYAVQFFWNDSHSSGIYSFEYLRELCPCPECRAR